MARRLQEPDIFVVQNRLYPNPICKDIGAMCKKKQTLIFAPRVGKVLLCNQILIDTRDENSKILNLNVMSVALLQKLKVGYETTWGNIHVKKDTCVKNVESRMFFILAYPDTPDRSILPSD